MSNIIPLFFKRLSKIDPGCGIGFAALALLAACAAPIPSSVPVDPNEASNRQIHAFNVALDKTFVGPASKSYGTILPRPVQQGISNFSGNLDLPADVANNLLQGRPHYAVENTARFLLNSTVGLAGLFDPATAIGLPQRKTDFGETLHVWGVGEGNYVELPAFGPSNERDTIGTIVDIVANPVGAIFPNAPTYVGTVAKIGSKLGDRNRYSETVDSVLYGSADGYAQARLLYMQNRRFELGQTVTSDDSFEDPYAE